jgi:UDP-glucuronate decarboxylase
MRILVAGGAGFLGSHLCKRLLDDGHEVLALDNFYTGSKSNIEESLTNSKFELIRHDVTVPFEIEVDAIYNLACPASPVHYQKFPVQTLKTSVLGALNLLELARRLNVRILQASTSEVYGDPQVSPQTEEYWGNVNPNGLRSCYDEGKRAAESLFLNFNRQYGVDIRVPRIFNTYGPHMALNDGRVVTNFINQALNNQPLTVYGDGSQTRSLCYVDDLIDGLVLLFEKPNIHQPINLGNPSPVTMYQLAEEIKSLCNSKSEIVFQALPSDDPLQREPDITKATQILGWTPQINRREGLKKTIEEVASRLN